ncbi:MAG: hypothetical protein J6E44_01350 [Lachnospiraceae bacterium]|nr:hypothetical protein [Lachnospiraceae bacterium]
MYGKGYKRILAYLLSAGLTVSAMFGSMPAYAESSETVAMEASAAEAEADAVSSTEGDGSDYVEEGGSDYVEEGGSDYSEEGGSDYSEEGGSDYSEEGGSDYSEEGGSDYSDEGGSDYSEEGGSDYSDDGGSSYTDDSSTPAEDDSNNGGSEEDYGEQNGSGENPESAAASSAAPAPESETAPAAESQTVSSAAESQTASSAVSSAPSSAASIIPPVLSTNLTSPVKAEASELVSLESLLGDLRNFGIVAGRIEFSDAAQRTNFAAGSISGNAVVRADLAGGTELVYMAGSVDGGSISVSEESTAGSDFIMTESGLGAVNAAGDSENVKFIPTNGDAISQQIEVYKGKIAEISRSLSGHAAAVLTDAGANSSGTVSAEVLAAATAATADAASQAAEGTGKKPDLVIDTTGIADSKTIYVNGDAVAGRIAGGELKIRKRAEQTIVISLTGSDVAIGSYEMTAGSDSGASAPCSSYANFLRKHAAGNRSAVIWNLPNAHNVRLSGTAGVVVAPYASVTLTSPDGAGSLSGDSAEAYGSSGFLLAGGTVKAVAAWHMLNENRQYPVTGRAERPEQTEEVTEEVTEETTEAAEEATGTETAENAPAEETVSAVESVIEAAEEETANAGEEAMAADETNSGAEEVKEPEATETAEKEVKPISLTFRLSNTLTFDSKAKPSGDVAYTFTLNQVEPKAETGQKPVTVKSVFKKAAISKATDKVSGTASFKAMSFAKAGTWMYELEEEALTAAGFSSDTAIRNVTLNIKEENGALVPTVDVDGTAVDIGAGNVVQLSTFNNRYDPEPITITMQVGNTLSFDPISKNSTKHMIPVEAASFQFALKPDGGTDEDEISVNYSLEELKSRVNESNIATSVSYEPITYTEAREYKYTLVEVNENKRGYTYDTATHNVIVSVKDSDGVLTATVTVDGKTKKIDQAGTVRVYDFKNKYRPEKYTTSFYVTKNVTTEGDDAGNHDPNNDTFDFEIRRPAQKEGELGILAYTASIKGTGRTVFKRVARKQNKNTNTYSYEQTEDTTASYSVPGTYTYELREKTPPLGYVKYSGIWRLELKIVDKGGWLEPSDEMEWVFENQRFHEPDIYNKYVTGSFSFKKVNAASVKTGLSGAGFDVYTIKSTDRNSKEYEAAETILKGGKVDYEVLRKFGSFTSALDGTVKITGLLPDTYYVIREVSAPKYYHPSKNAVIISTPYDYKNDEFQTKVSSAGDTTMGVDASTKELKWYDHKIQVRIDKVTTDGSLLKGAKMQLIKDSTGEIVEKWSSGVTKGHTVKYALSAGETYTVKEVQAPKNYKIADAISFTVNGDAAGGYGDKNTIQVVKMTDKKKASNSSRGGSGSGGSASATQNARTGDTNPIFLYLALAAVAAAIVIFLLFRRGRRK